MQIPVERSVWGPDGLWIALWVGFFLGVVIVHIRFAVGVLLDSRNPETHHRGVTAFVPGVIWALATLLGGVFVAAVYWAIHHSTLVKESPT